MQQSFIIFLFIEKIFIYIYFKGIPGTGMSYKESLIKHTFRSKLLLGSVLTFFLIFSFYDASLFKENDKKRRNKKKEEEDLYAKHFNNK